MECNGDNSEPNIGTVDVLVPGDHVSALCLHSVAKAWTYSGQYCALLYSCSHQQRLALQGNVLVSISGVNFKDRGSVTMTNEDTTMTCATPAFGTSGNVSGPYWSPSGTLIQVCILYIPLALIGSPRYHTPHTVFSAEWDWHGVQLPCDCTECVGNSNRSDLLL